MGQMNDTSGVRIFPPAIFASGLLIGLILTHFFPTFVLGAAAARITGIVFFVAGVAFIASAIALFRRAHTNVNPTQPTTSIVVTGPFTLTRNPIYLGNCLVYLGVTIFFQSIWSLLLLIPVIIVLQREAIAREESYLERKFGQAYLQYKARVRRWL